MSKSFTCPACGSDRVQKARILKRAGIPISTEVANKISPPVEPTSAVRQAGWISICIGALLTMGIYTLGTGHTIRIDRIGLFLQIMGVFLGVLGMSLLAVSQLEIKAKTPKYEQDYARWERLWYCSHCKNTFLMPE